MTVDKALQNYVRRWNREWNIIAIAAGLMVLSLCTVAFFTNGFLWAYLFAGLVFGLGIGMAVLFFSRLFLFRFLRKIRYQEKRFSLPFSDENETIIESRMGDRSHGGNPACHLSENWFFSLGLFAYCKPYVKTLTYTLEKNAHDKPYYEVRVLTVDDTCHTHVFHAEEDARTVLNWYNN